MSSEEIWLCGAPYRRDTVEAAQRHVTALRDVMEEDRGQAPPWVIALEAAVRHQLRENHD